MTGSVRIIAGRFRRRRLQVPAVPGLRPTPDRVRETLFNWLSPEIRGARCLDLFAGSGALGLEAVSRGAREVVMLDRAEPVVQALRENVRRLGAPGVNVVRADARRWLAGEGEAFDIVFLDPPYAEDLLAPSCSLLAANGWLSPLARVYLEARASRGFPELPPDWRLTKEKSTGQVRYGLAQTGGHPRHT